MQPCFQNKPLHLTVCLLLAWKGISTIVWFLLDNAGIFGYEGFFLSTGFISHLCLLMIAAFSESRTFFFVALAVIIVALIVYWVFFILLAINRSGAGVASVALLILCGLDFPLTLDFSFSGGWSSLLSIAFHVAILLTVVLLRRSRPGVTVPLNKIPKDI